MYQFLASQIGTAACIGLLTIFYIVFLKRETFFRLNRYILLAILVISLIVPQLKLPVRNEALPTDPIEKIRETVSLTSSTVDYRPTAIGHDEIRTETSYMNLAALIGILYLAGVILSLSLTLFGIFKIMSLRRKAEVLYYNGKILYAIDDKFSTFTFLGMIFIRKSVDGDECAPNIISHEMVHARQKHSLDILFFELVKAIQWFNPFVYLLGREMRAVHEYIADYATIIETKDRKEYMATLLNQALGAQMSGLANNFNGKTIMKRLKMITKTKSPKLNTLKYCVLILPIIAVLFTFSSQGKDKPTREEYLKDKEQSLPNDLSSYPKPVCGSKTYGKMLRAELKMPEEALKNNITSAWVSIKFKINLDSTISDIRINNAKTGPAKEWGPEAGYGFDEEALRIFKKIAGKWVPAERNGVPVVVENSESIVFGTLDEWEKFNPPSKASVSKFTNESGKKVKEGDMYWVCCLTSWDELMGDNNQELTNWSYIMTHFKVPKAAMKHKVEGVAEVRFRINDKGQPDDIKSLKNYGYGISEMAEKMISELKDFTPNQKFEGNKEYLTVAIAFSKSEEGMERVKKEYKKSHLK